MENEVERVISDAERMCVAFLNAEQIRQLRGVLSIVLRDCTVKKEETALSTEFSISNAEYINRFLVLKTVKGCSKQTIEYYKQTMMMFFRNVTKPMPGIDANDIRAYLAIRERRDGVSKISLDNELRVLRSFFHTMHVEEYIARDPTARVESIKVPTRVKKPFTELELEKIREACEDERQRAMVEVLYSTGCRVSEMIGMDWNDINGDEVLVHGKGGKDRICFLSPRAMIALEAYKKTRKDDWPEVFVRKRKAEDGKGMRICDSVVESTMREIGKRAGVEKVHPTDSGVQWPRWPCARGCPLTRSAGCWDMSRSERRRYMPSLIGTKLSDPTGSMYKDEV